MSTYSEKLKDPRWQKKRLEILNRDKFTCQVCEDTETELQVHHFKYSGNPWEAENGQLITCCKYCHESLEDIRKGDLTFLGSTSLIRNEETRLVVLYVISRGMPIALFMNHTDGELVCNVAMTEKMVEKFKQDFAEAKAVFEAIKSPE